MKIVISARLLLSLQGKQKAPFIHPVISWPPLTERRSLIKREMMSVNLAEKEACDASESQPLFVVVKTHIDPPHGQLLDQHWCTGLEELYEHVRKALEDNPGAWEIIRPMLILHDTRCLPLDIADIKGLSLCGPLMGHCGGSGSVFSTVFGDAEPPDNLPCLRLSATRAAESP